MKLLIDADFTVYKSCAACEYDIDYGDDVIIVQSKFTEVMKMIKYEIKKIERVFPGYESVLFFSDSVNFRKQIASDYKGSRTRKKPCGYKRALAALEDDYRIIKLPTLEADDALGVYATKYPGNVLVSPDKDLRQIAGTLYDLKTTTEITKEEGDQWHFIQTLSGDQTDGYTGCPGYGLLKSTKLFEKEGFKWSSIVKAFKSKGLTEADALRNARLAKILQNEDYNFKKKEPIMWNPKSL